MNDSAPRVLSLFSGVGGFDMGLEQAGMEIVYQCEWEKKCQSVLRRHWPDVPLHDDVSTLTGKMVLDAVGHVDVVAWGSPCQDLSVAGKGAGLAGEKSGLFYEGIRIINELREESSGASPRWSIWENVRGAFSSNRGRDFGVVIDQMAEAGAVVIEWRLLDAQFFGVPQRRRRIFVVAGFHPRDDNGQQILPFPESVCGNNQAGGTTGEETAGDVDAGTFSNSGFEKWKESTIATGLSVRDYKDHGQTLITPFVKVVRSGAGVADRHAVAFSHTQGLDAQPSEKHWPTLREGGGGHAVAFDEYNSSINDTTHHSIRGGTPQSTGVINNAQVRRLTPIECERLMGWPDDHTKLDSEGNVIADSHRYKMCGNGVVSAVARWVGEQVMEQG